MSLIKWALIASLYTRHFSNVMAEPGVPSDWVLSIVDPSGRIMVRSRNNDQFAGKLLVPELVRHMQARGTGTYRIAPLVDVANAAPYLHHGAVRDLDELLSPKRLAADFEGRLGKGAIPGHTFGTDLAADDRAALISFLSIL